MKVIFFVSATSGLLFKLIYHGASTVVHLLILKFSMAEHKLFQHFRRCKTGAKIERRLNAKETASNFVQNETKQIALKSKK